MEYNITNVCKIQTQTGKLILQEFYPKKNKHAICE